MYRHRLSDSACRGGCSVEGRLLLNLSRTTFLLFKWHVSNWRIDYVPLQVNTAAAATAAQTLHVTPTLPQFPSPSHGIRVPHLLIVSS